MKYKIGDTARILGVSADQLRYYEKKGVLTPVKAPGNDYRYYDEQDLDILMDCLWFRNFGFSVTQIAEMVCISSIQRLSSLFCEKEDELRATITRCELLLKRSEAHRQGLALIPRLLGKCEQGMSPELIWSINRCMSGNANSVELQRMSRAWLELLPFTFRCFEIAQENLLRDNGISYRWGAALTMDYAQKLQVHQDQSVLHLPSEPSIHSVFKSSGAGNVSPGHIKYMVDHAREQGLTIAGAVRGQLLASVLEDSVLTCYYEVWLPVSEA